MVVFQYARWLIRHIAMIFVANRNECFGFIFKLASPHRFVNHDSPAECASLQVPLHCLAEHQFRASVSNIGFACKLLTNSKHLEINFRCSVWIMANCVFWPERRRSSAFTPMIRLIVFIGFRFVYKPHCANGQCRRLGITR